MSRARNSRLRTFARVTGSRNRCASSIFIWGRDNDRHRRFHHPSKDAVSLVRFAWDEVGQPVNYLVRGDAVGLGIEVGYDAVAQHCWSHGADIFARNMVSAMK